jgi:hypothetical protein
MSLRRVSWWGPTRSTSKRKSMTLLLCRAGYVDDVMSVFGRVRCTSRTRTPGVFLFATTDAYVGSS